MRILLMVDMEGISGICRSEQVSKGDPAYNEGRLYMAWDINACVDGCFAGGAKKVTVRDAHGSGHNVPWHELDPRATYVQGRSAVERMPGIADCDGLILLGYHAMAGTRHAILEHTMSSREWQNFWLNGKKAGEFAIDAALAGDHGVPTIMTSGDDKLCREARRTIKGIVAVEVKKGLDCQGGILLPKEQAHARIREGAAKAVAQCTSVKPYKVKSPVTMRLEVVSRGRLPETRAGVKIIDGRTWEAMGKTVEGTFSLLVG